MRASQLLAAAILLAGCSVLDLEIGRPLDLAESAAFQPGRTRRAEVLAALGPPVDLAVHAEGVALLYEHVRLGERQFGLSFQEISRLLGIPGLAWIKLSLGRSGSEREAALFVFDAEGVLSSAATSHWTEVFGKSGSLQLVFAVEQVVDSGSLRGDPRGLSWGLELLEPLPQALNQPQRADLELRGTPTQAGQRSLEQRGHEAEER